MSQEKVHNEQKQKKKNVEEDLGFSLNRFQRASKMIPKRCIHMQSDNCLKNMDGLWEKPTCKQAKMG